MEYSLNHKLLYLLGPYSTCHQSSLHTNWWHHRHFLQQTCQSRQTHLSYILHPGMLFLSHPMSHLYRGKAFPTDIHKPSQCFHLCQPKSPKCGCLSLWYYSTFSAKSREFHPLHSLALFVSMSAPEIPSAGHTGYILQIFWLYMLRCHPANAV